MRRWACTALVLAAGLANAQTSVEDENWAAELRKPSGKIQEAIQYFAERGAKATPTLSKALRDKSLNLQQRIWFYHAAAATRDPKVVPAVLEAAGRHPYGVAGGLWKEIPFVPLSLSAMGPAGEVEVAKGLRSPNVLTRRVAAQLLADEHKSGSVPREVARLVEQARHDPDPFVAVLAAWNREAPLHPSDYRSVIRFQHVSDPVLRGMALRSAVDARSSEAKKLRIDHLSDPEEQIGMQFSAIPLRGNLKPGDYAVLSKKLSSTKGRGRAYVANVLGYLRDKQAIPALQTLLHDDDQRVVAAAFNAIRRINGELP